MNKKQKAILYMILSAFCFAWMNAFVRMSGDLPPMQKSFFRNLVAAVFAMAVLLKKGTGFRFQKENLPYFMLRSIFGTVGIVCNFYAIDHLALSDASMLNKMSPFFAILFSYFILKERLTIFQGAAVVVAFVGSLFIIKPSFANMDLLPSMIGLLGGLCAGAAYTYVRKLGQRGEAGPFIVFFFSAFSCLAMLPWLLFDYASMTGLQLLCLLGAGMAAAGGQFSITAAYCNAPAKEVSVYDYSQILFSAALGFFLFGDLPDGLSVVGYLLICGTAVAMFLHQGKK